MKIIDKIKKFLVRNSIIKGNFYAQGMIFSAAGKPSKEPTDTVKWLDKMQVHCYYNEQANKFFDMLGELHPEYKGYFYLY